MFTELNSCSILMTNKSCFYCRLLLRKYIKLNKIIHIDHVTPRKFQCVKKLQNVSLFQQSKNSAHNYFGYPEALCDRGTPSKPEVSLRKDRVNKTPSWLTL